MLLLFCEVQKISYPILLYETCSYLLHILPFGDILISNLDSGVAEVFQQICRVQAHQIRSFISLCNSTRNKSRHQQLKPVVLLPLLE